MWEILQSVLSPIFQVLEWVRKIINSWIAWLFWLLVLLLAPLQWVFETVTYWFLYLTYLINQMTDRVHGFWSSFNSSYSQISEYIAISNGLFPVGHLFSAIGVLLILWVLAIIYRLIKSYVPTLS